ncbi:protein EMBRYO DEFECTIVE 514 [Aristolochia californica]|uniref:protein EMBRYO DEFECTIVE 514 n=1 Tax=Aristolochia californica TaxID=171875 RepID=UPI0035E1F954
MAEVKMQNPEIGGDKPEETDTVTNMGLENPEHDSNEEPMDASNHSTKRAREDVEVAGDDEVPKKQKSDQSVEGKKLEDSKEDNEAKKGEEREGKEVDGKEDEFVSVTLGPKTFGSSVEMFEYFFKLLHSWPPNLNVNKYEYMVLVDLLSKGHTSPEEKIGGGISSFQIRYHPMWKSRCFFLLREDGFVDDFSFRKCVDKILPLPEHMKVPNSKHSEERKSHGGGRGGRGGGGRGGRGGRGRGNGGSRK